MDKSAIYTRHNELPEAHPTGFPQEVRSNDNFPEVVQSRLPEVAPYDDKSLGHYESQSQGQPKWWRRHWIWLLIAVLVVAIAIGGGVGGGLASNKSHPPSPNNGTGFTSTLLPTNSAAPTMSGSAAIQTDYSFPTAVATDPTSRLDVFSTSFGPARAVSRKTYLNNTWFPSQQNFEYMPLSWPARVNSRTGSNIAAILLVPNQTQYFYIGNDSETYNGYVVPSGWGPLEGLIHLNGSVVSSIDGVSWNAYRIDIFALRGEGKLWQLTWESESSWGPWTPFGGDGGNSTYAYTPSAVSWGTGRGDVFVVDKNSLEVLHSSWVTEGKPILFENIGGYCTSRPSAVSWGVKNIALFCRGGDAQLWRTNYDSSNWTDWERIGEDKEIVNEPHAISQYPGRIDVFVQTVNNTAGITTFDNTWTNKSWNWGWWDMGGSFIGPPKAVASSLGGGLRMDIFAYDTKGNLMHRWWNGSEGGRFFPDVWENLGTP